MSRPDAPFSQMPMLDRLAYSYTTTDGPDTEEPYDLVRWFLHRTAKEVRRAAPRSGRAGGYDAGFDAGVTAVIRLLYKEARR